MRIGTMSPASAWSMALPNLDTVIRGLLYLYVLSLPFHRLLFVERNGFIILLVLLTLWCLVNRGHFFVWTPIHLPLIAFVGWVAFTVPFAAFPLYSLQELGKLLQQALLFSVVLFFFRDSPYRLRLVWVMMVALLIISAYGIFEFKDLIGERPPGLDLAYVTSFTGAEVWLTTYLIMMAPLSYALFLFESKLYPRICYGCLLALGLGCLLFTFSRPGILSQIIELWLFVWLTKRRIALVIAGGLTVVTLTAGISLYLYAASVPGGLHTIPGTTISPIKATISSLEHRRRIWAFTLTKLFEHPVMGIGYGKDNFKRVYGKSPKTTDQTQYEVTEAGTHNTYLDIALGVGIPGLILFLWLISRIVTKLLTNFYAADTAVDKAIALGVTVSVVGISVRLFFDHMLIGTVALAFWILVALAMHRPYSKHLQIDAVSKHSEYGKIGAS